MAKIKVSSLVILWVIVIGLGLFIAPIYQEHQKPQRDLPPLAKSLEVLGESRYLLGQLLFIKMDLFHEVYSHRGQDETGLIPLGRLASYLYPGDPEIFDIIAFMAPDEQAETIAKEGIKINPESFKLNIRLAMIAYKNKQWEQCIEYSTKAFIYSQDLRGALSSFKDKQNATQALRYLYEGYRGTNNRKGMALTLRTWYQTEPKDYGNIVKRLEEDNIPTPNWLPPRNPNQ